ncbi:hypothetical protein GPECTOR_39g465 [Gonium pectorale]|uniref:Uncharacterized protein n=1 Tax=Gonium pectorale TaxID=33097 RepID=A0A150GAU3_GONPE|nr:hypothetical protein GPECTOR_39g465 [Gonium pectorale]|eukprot:KXZ46971.1 hypothetical protein GPECTOR_39g465 [Gonium pectorale]
MQLLRSSPSQQQQPPWQDLQGLAAGGAADARDLDGDGGDGRGYARLGSGGWGSSGRLEQRDQAPDDDSDSLLELGPEELEALPHLDLRNLAPSVARNVNVERVNLVLRAVQAASDTPSGRGRWVGREEVEARQAGAPTALLPSVLATLNGVRVGGYAVLRKKAFNSRRLLYRVVRMSGTPAGAPMSYCGEFAGLQAPATERGGAWEGPPWTAEPPPDASLPADAALSAFTGAGAGEVRQRPGPQPRTKPPPPPPPLASMADLWARLQQAMDGAAESGQRLETGTLPPDDDIDGADSQNHLHKHCDFQSQEQSLEQQEKQAQQQVRGDAAREAAAYNRPAERAGAQKDMETEATGVWAEEGQAPLDGESVVPLAEALLIPELDVLSLPSYVKPQTALEALNALLPALQRLCAGGRCTTRAEILDELGLTAATASNAHASLFPRLREARIGGYVVIGQPCGKAGAGRGPGQHKLIQYSSMLVAL